MIFCNDCKEEIAGRASVIRGVIRHEACTRKLNPPEPDWMRNVSRVRVQTKDYGGNCFLRGRSVTVVVVHPDGSETPIPGLKSVEWSVGGRQELCIAKITLIGVEIDAEASEIHIVPVEPQPDAPLGADRDKYDENGKPIVAT